MVYFYGSYRCIFVLILMLNTLFDDIKQVKKITVRYNNWNFIFGILTYYYSMPWFRPIFTMCWIIRFFDFLASWKILIQILTPYMFFIFPKNSNDVFDIFQIPIFRMPNIFASFCPSMNFSICFFITIFNSAFAHQGKKRNLFKKFSKKMKINA